MLADAAGAYEAAESWAAAGGVYIRAGHKDLAAQCYERANDPETAAKLYEEAGMAARAIPLFEKAGLTFKSGEAAAAVGDRDRAISLLQRVPASDENFRTATEILARLFLESGRAPLAIDRLQRAIGGQPVSTANLDLYYWLAIAQEKDQPAEALALYKKIQAEHLGFKDVDDRTAAIGSGEADRLRAASAAAAVSMARPSIAAPKPARSRGRTCARRRGVRRPRCGQVGQARLRPARRGRPRPAGCDLPRRGPRRPQRGHAHAAPAVLAGNGVLSALAADLKAAAALSHPNGVKVLGFVEHAGNRCIVTEFVQGRHLGDALETGRPAAAPAPASGTSWPSTSPSSTARASCTADIQPSNIMVANGVLKVADMELGQLAYNVPSDVDYRAPENLLDVAGDLYAMSAVLYHVLTGVHPKKQAQGAAMPLPSTYSNGVPEALDKLLIRALHPRVELRFASADEVLAELKNMVRLA